MVHFAQKLHRDQRATAHRRGDRFGWIALVSSLVVGCGVPPIVGVANSGGPSRPLAHELARDRSQSECVAREEASTGRVDPEINVECVKRRLKVEVDELLSRQPLTSGIVLVVASNQVLFSRVFGFADRAQKTPITAETSFRIGSVTKTFTAAAIVRLAGEGKLAFDDPIQRYLPEFPVRRGVVTIHQLLTHTSPLVNYTSLPWFDANASRPVSTAELLRSFWNEVPRFWAAGEFAYSNSNYAVLGAIIERVTGKPYADYMRTEIFAPHGLCRTVVGDDEGAPNRAVGYQVQGGEMVPAEPLDLSLAFAAGAMRSTANDLVRWHRVLSGPALIPASQRWRLYQWTPHGYAYGWRIEDWRGTMTAGHTGAINGFQSAYIRIPSLDFVAVALSNDESVSLHEIKNAAVRAALARGDRC